MDEKLTQLQSEYERLREEIMQADSRNYQVLGIIVAGSAALLVAAFKQGTEGPSLVALLGYAVTIPGYGMLCANRKRIWRVSTYMRVFLETELVFTQWETRLDAQRAQAPGPKSRTALSTLAAETEWLAVALVNFAAAFCSAWAIVNIAGGVNRWSVSFIYVLLMANFGLWLWTRISGE